MSVVDTLLHGLKRSAGRTQLQLTFVCLSPLQVRQEVGAYRGINNPLASHTPVMAAVGTGQQCRLQLPARRQGACLDSQSQGRPAHGGASASAAGKENVPAAAPPGRAQVHALTAQFERKASLRAQPARAVPATRRGAAEQSEAAIIHAVPEEAAASTIPCAQLSHRSVMQPAGHTAPSTSHSSACATTGSTACGTPSLPPELQDNLKLLYAPYNPEQQAADALAQQQDSDKAQQQRDEEKAVHQCRLQEASRGGGRAPAGQVRHAAGHGTGQDEAAGCSADCKVEYDDNDGVPEGLQVSML